MTDGPDMAGTRVIHVRCTDTGTWTVHPEGYEEPISTHSSETEAERAAHDHAAAHGGGHIVVRDRYRRTHVVRDQGSASRSPS